MRKQVIFAVSGVKNSGKTTLIERILPVLVQKGLKVAVIKHDGHDFEPDVPGTDSYRYAKQGAYGTAVFSEQRFMIMKQQRENKVEQLLSYFSEADLILLEGFKYSCYPKLEVIRRGNSDFCVCPKEHLLAIATDIEKTHPNFQNAGIRILNLEETVEIAEFVYQFYQSAGESKQ